MVVQLMRMILMYLDSSYMHHACRHPIHRQLRTAALHGLRRYGNTAPPLGFVFDIVRVFVCQSTVVIYLALGWRPYQRTQCSPCC